MDIANYTTTLLTLHTEEVNCSKTEESPILTGTSNPIDMFSAYADVWICLPPSFVPVSCSELWINLGICSTVLEVHNPLNETSIISLQINSYNEPDQSPANLPLIGLCAGTYHLWLVEYSRVGKILLGLTAFYIYEPSC